MPKKRVVITGIGPISSIGIGKDALWQGVVKGRANIEEQEVNVENELWAKYFLHKVKDFDIKKFNINQEALDYIREWKQEEAPVDLYFLLAAIKLALEDGKIKPDDNSLGLVLAHENLGLIPFAAKLSQRSFDILTKTKNPPLSRKKFYEQVYQDCLKSCYDAQTFMNLFHVAKAFNIHNYSLFINNACASGLYGLEAARQIINSNQASKVIIAVSEFTDIYKYLWFNDIGLYSPDGKIRPFCKDSNGLVFGDGAVALILEDLLEAKKRKATIYAEYLGGGFSLEGWKVTTPQLGSDSYQQAITNAFKQAGIKREDIELLCPHGIGSQPIDYYEAKAITDTFGKNPKKPLITTFKPYIGHTLGASALLETSILLLALKNNLIPQTLNYENPDPKFNLTLLKKAVSGSVKTAMKIACAFAGYNAAAIFRKI